MNLGGIRVSSPADDVLALAWGESTDGPALEATLREVAEDALRTGIRRLEAARPEADRVGRRALLRAGFQVEGVSRQAFPRAGGGYDDLVRYGRLDTDRVGGAYGFSAVMNSALPRKRLIAHVLLRDEADRVLLCATTFKADWELPGGVVEPGEPPRLGAVREVAEELGIDRPLGRLLVVDWLPPYLGWDDAIEMIFDGGRVTAEEVAAYVLQPSEIAAVHLCTLAEAEERVTPLAYRRLALAASLGPHQVAYTEDGRTV